MDGEGERAVLAMLAGKRVVVAFSGGVDSSVLLALALQACSQVHAVFLDSPLCPRDDKARAMVVAGKLGTPVSVETVEPLDDEAVSRNDKQRCYACKRGIFQHLLAIKDRLGFDAVIEGTNADDENDVRPGMRAVRELGAWSPLRDARLGKVEIRTIAARLGLPNAGDPSNACLASRVAHGIPLTRDILQRVDDAEHIIKDTLQVSVARARVHEGAILRIELDPGEMDRALARGAGALRGMATRLRDLGFSRIVLDLEGYTTGSMNRLS